MQTQLSSAPHGSQRFLVDPHNPKHPNRPFLSSSSIKLSSVLPSTKALLISINKDHFLNRVARENSLPLTMSSTTVKLPVIEATASSFKGFGQVIEASADGEEFGPRDAQLDLSRGVPRFYIMQLEDRPFEFSKITHHANVTQCLGSIGGHVWYLGVAKASIVNPSELNSDSSKKVVLSRCGHYYVPPVPEDVCLFRISGPKFLKLHTGTWHAGPLFKADTMDFYNLELSNTNVVDHTTHDFSVKNGVVFSFYD